MVAVPDPAGEGLHAAPGLGLVGTVLRSCRELGARRDVARYRRAPGDGPVDDTDGAAPPEPR